MGDGVGVRRPLVVGGGVLLMAGMLVLVTPLVLFGLAVAAWFGGDPSDGDEVSGDGCEFVDAADEASLAVLHAEALAALFPKEARTGHTSCSGIEAEEIYEVTVLVHEERPSFEDLDAALEPLGWRRREGAEGTEDVARLAVLFDRGPTGRTDVELRIDAEHEGLFVAVRITEA
jgi:hypothetical protein